MAGATYFQGRKIVLLSLLWPFRALHSDFTYGLLRFWAPIWVSGDGLLALWGAECVAKAAMLLGGVGQFYIGFVWENVNFEDALCASMVNASSSEDLGCCFFVLGRPSFLLRFWVSATQILG